MKSAFLCSLVAVELVLVRVWIGRKFPPSPMTGVDVFKDIAHLFVGLLIGFWWVERKPWQRNLIIWLCVAETAVAVISRL